MKRLKKILIALALILLILLSAVYLAVNSPYVVDRIARKYAPEFGFSYARIRGNPLQGLTLEDLRYKGRKLAREIRIRLNPYTLLEKTLTVSRLTLTDVDVPTLEKVILDFSAPSEDPEPTEAEENGFALPIGIRIENIRLSLLPFRRYGVDVTKEVLSVDSIYYDSGTFSVGALKQIADTSLGMVELEGTYRRRVLDVRFLAVEDLDLTRLETLLKRIGVLGGEETAPDGNRSEGNVTAAGTPESEDIFLPRKIRADRLWITLKPYEAKQKVRLKWAQLEGRNLAVDLEHRRITDGSLRTELRTDLGNARLKLSLEPGKATLEEGVIDTLDLQRILALSRSDTPDTTSQSVAEETSAEHNATGGSIPLDHFPFVPASIEVQHLRVELRPGEMEGITYRDATLKLRNLTADLHRNRLSGEGIEAYLDTPLAHLYVDAGIDRQAIRIRHLDLRGVDPETLQRLVESDRTKRTPAAAPPVKAHKSVSTKAKGMTLPFVPSLIVLERGRVEVSSFARDPLKLESATATMEDIRFDLRNLQAEKGRLKLRLRSDLAQAKLEGTLRNNVLKLDAGGSNGIRLHRELFERFDLPVRAEAFSPIRLGGTIDESGADLNLSFSARDLLRSDRNASFNVDINRSITTVRFGFADGKFRIDHSSRIDVPQAPDIRLKAHLTGEGKTIRYTGTLDAGALKLGAAKIEKMLGHPRIDFRGDLHRLSARLSAGAFEGNFSSADLKKGVLTLGTSHAIRPAEYITLPEKLAPASLTLQSVTPVDFTKPLPLATRLTLRSNLADINGTVRYDGNLSAKLVTRFPKHSLLERFDPRLRLAAIDPLTLSVDQQGERWQLTLKSRPMAGRIDYAPSRDSLEGTLTVAGTRIRISGQPRKMITATLTSPSVKRLIGGLTDLYRVEVPSLDGDVSLTLKIDRLSSATLELRSRQFVPDAGARIKSPIENIELLLGADMKQKRLILRKLHLETAGMKIFATRPSVIRLDGDRIVLQELWINDSLKIQGDYDLKKAKGELTARSQRFHLVHEYATLDAAVDLRAKIDGEKIDAKGKVTILGGQVHYNMEAKHYATDDDIVILQHRKKDEESFFTKNVQLNLYIEDKKPLLFKEKNVYVELRPQLSIIKGFGSDLQMMGSIALAKGGYYTFEGKRFVLQPSSINFTGKPTQPLLDINLVYRRFSRTVYITVSGLATEPNLNFSSDPYMTRDQILSFILFDTVDSGQDAGDMMSMVGGGIAKSILGNIGLKVDTLVVTTEGFEVGKKITDKITVLYDQKTEDPKVIVRIQNSKRTETDISIGSESQSVDIIYKREF